MDLTHEITKIKSMRIDRDTIVHSLRFLTKGDNNKFDDRMLYPKGVSYLEEDQIIGTIIA